MSYIFDIETNGLLPELTKIHCLCMKDITTNKIYSYTTEEQIRLGLSVLNSGEDIIGHNIISFDIPAIQKIYPDWKPIGKVVDTLVLSRLIIPKINFIKSIAVLKIRKET